MRTAFTIGRSTRSRRRAGAAALVGAVVLALLVVLLPSPGSIARAADAEESTGISEGSLRWGVRESFRKYITSIASGTLTAADGAVIGADGVPVFPLTGGTFDPATSATVVQFGGSIHFWGHKGLLDLTITTPRVEITAAGASLSARVKSRPLNAPGDGDYGEVVLATLDAAAGSLTIDGGITRWDRIDAALSEAGAPAFAGHYRVGEPLDPVSFRYTGPGGGPVEPTETWDLPGVQGFRVEADKNYEVNWSLFPISLSADRTALFVLRGLPFSGWNVKERKSVLQAVDPETLAPIDDGVVFPTHQLSVSSGLLAADPATNTVFLRSYVDDEERIIAVRWDAASHGYGTEYLNPAGDDPALRAVTSFVWDDVHGRLVGLRADGRGVVSYSRSADGTWQRISVQFGADGVRDPGAGISGIDVTTEGLVVAVRDAGALDPALVLDLDQTPVAVTDVPGSVPDTAGRSYSAVRAVSDGGFLLVDQGESPGILPIAKRGAAYSPGSRFGLSGNAGPTTGQRSHDPESDTTYLSARSGIVVLRDNREVGVVPHAEETGNDSVVAAGADTFFRQGVNGALQRIRLTGTTPVIETSPSAQTATIGVDQTAARVAFSVGASGDGLTYQWQSRPAGATSVLAWKDISGATSSSWAFDATGADNGTQYRVVVGNAAGRLASDAAALTVRTAPTVLTITEDQTVGSGERVRFVVMPGGDPTPTVQWQQRFGADWRDVGAEGAVSAEGAILTIGSTTTALDGSRFRARLTNDVATTFSKEVALAVRAPARPRETTTYRGVGLDWSGSAVLQHKPPVGAAYTFSAGASDGTRATYSAEAAGVTIIQRDAAGGESTATWETRGAHTRNGGSQIVRAAEGTAIVQPDGSAVVTWPATFSVNTYDGLVPFTLSDLRLDVAADGRGTLTADLSGYSGDIADPDRPKQPATPVDDVTVATFHGAVVDTAGVLTVVPDYAGVEITTPEQGVAQLREGTGWGSWPQAFVDFQQTTGLGSYFYSSGGSFDPHKAPLPFTIGFASAVAEPVPGGLTPPAPDVPGAPGFGLPVFDDAARGPGALAVTGAEVPAGVLVAATLALVAGGVLLVAARRRARSTSREAPNRP